MARRMFSSEIVDSDAFLEMPISTQALYFHLGMQADDDGFIGNPKKILRGIGVSEDDLKILMAKRFVLTFESGVIVIKHWKINNYLRADRYHETKYLEEKGKLLIKENNSYSEKDKLGIPKLNQWSTENRLDKNRLDKTNTFVLSEGQERELEKILITWNEIYKQKLKSIRAIRSNYKYWREVYEFDEIIQAIKKSPKTWLAGKPIETFFRQKNPNGELVDYISQCLNFKEEQDKGGVLVIR